MRIELNFSLTMEEGWNSGEFKSVSEDGEDAGDGGGSYDDSTFGGIWSSRGGSYTISVDSSVLKARFSGSGELAERFPCTEDEGDASSSTSESAPLSSGKDYLQGQIPFRWMDVSEKQYSPVTSSWSLWTCFKMFSSEPNLFHTGKRTGSNDRANHFGLSPIKAGS